MKVKIIEVLETINKTSKAGKSYSVTTFKGDDGKLYKDIFGKLETGAEVEGEWKQTEWGEKFEITRQQGGGNGRYNDPETGKQIIRQNALTNAVAFCTAKAQMQEAKEGIKYLSGKQVIQVATYFAAYSQGKATVVMTPAEIATAFGYEIKEEAPLTEDDLNSINF
jgi:hypothetical protein